MSITRLLTVAAAAAGLLALGGCVPQSQYDELMSVNMAANERLESQQSQLRQLRTENDRLLEQLRQMDEQLRRGTGGRAELQAQNAQLLTQLRDVQRRLEAALTDRQPAMIGPILPQPLHEALEGFARANPDLIEYVADRGMLKLKSDLTFALGSAEVRPDAQQALARFAGILSGADPESQAYHVYIAGHTDNVPIGRPETRQRHPNNWYLSVHRAVSVQEVLAEAGLSENRLGVMGFGQHHPIVENPARGGADANRRVEIWIVPPSRFLTTPGGGQVASDAPQRTNPNEPVK